MKTLASGFVIALAVAVLALFWAWGDERGLGKPSDSLRPGSSAADTLSLRTPGAQPEASAERFAELLSDDELLERLAARVAALEARLAQLEANGSDALPPIEVSEETEVIHTDAPGPAGRSPGSGRPWFHDASLEKLGFTPGEVERIRETWEYTVMETLELETDRVRNGEKGWWAAVRDQEWIEAQA
ncbi:hypothetical protein MK280_09930, partial [Myxococcota bacterium]|nr:hypothetical protein [Myxococcota bacterium]